MKPAKLTTRDHVEIHDNDDRPGIGSWWWVKDPESEDCDQDGCWLACVVDVGSNFAKLSGARWQLRLALDDFHQQCTAEPDHGSFISGRVGRHRERIRELMSEIQQVCHRLGVPVRQTLAAAEAPSQALAVAHGVDDVKAYQAQLVVARDETLPELFKQVKEQHAEMAKWMKVDLIPVQAEIDASAEIKETISGKIHTVELYAGLQENLTQVREGAPANIDEKVHIMQRRHYMDEECLARYEAGGMDFEDVGAFDAWLSRDGNFGRLLPHPKTIIAFRIRRNAKKYSKDPIETFIRMFDGSHDQNQRTFLYIRNGQQLWRMETSISFNDQLFPRREESDLLGDDEIWVKHSAYDIEHGSGIITGRQRARMIQAHTDERRLLARELWQWHRAGCPDGDWAYLPDNDENALRGWTPGSTLERSGDPRGRRWGLHQPTYLKYTLLTPQNIFYDDVSRKIAQAAFDHNRVAVVVQGLLDRSTCLHPHPPWRIWTAEGFASGIHLVHDASLAITPGDKPDWDGYRRQLNKSLRAGCHTIGQQGAWRDAMENAHGSKWKERVGYGNRGPAVIHRVDAMRRGRLCEFRWKRERMKAIWVPAERTGYVKKGYPEIETSWRCSADHLTCVDAYTPGDFHIFFDDPRTRADYLEWAPVLLACEDWHHARSQGSTPAADLEND